MPTTSPTVELLNAVVAYRESLDTNKLENIYFTPYRDRTPEMMPEEWGPYDWQIDFHNMDCAERMLMSGNRTGKTRSCAAEVGIHCTGLYPPWWEGRRFKTPVQAMVGGVSNLLTRNVPQLALLGEIDGTHADRKPTGKGWIPLKYIGECSFRQCGIQNVCDQVKIKHVSGGWSTISFMSYEQSVNTFQGVARHIIWLDEEPEGEHAQKYYSEVQTRTVDVDGIVIMSRTPLFGKTKIIKHFINGNLDPKLSIGLVQAGWNHCPHISEKMRKQMVASLPPHEILCRTEGEPMLGSGMIYNISDAELAVEPFEIPDHYRQIFGIDIGIDHPTASVKLAIDPVNEQIYVTDEYRAKGEGVIYHAAALKARGADRIPVAWPHDARSRDKGSAQRIVDQYVEHGLKMMDMSARFDDEKGGGQSTDAIIMMIQDLMKQGRIKIFNTCRMLFEEKNQYHRKDGKIVRESDDLISALHYAIMMLRYAECDVRGFNRFHRVSGGRPKKYTTYDPFLGV